MVRVRVWVWVWVRARFRVRVRVGFRARVRPRVRAKGEIEGEAARCGARAFEISSRYPADLDRRDRRHARHSAPARLRCRAVGWRLYAPEDGAARA